jgi:Tetratricopeptide repeat
LGNLGHYEDALLALERAVVLRPDDAVAWNNTGTALNSLGRHADALVAYNRALALNQNHRSAWIGKDSALDALGHRRVAQEAARLAEALDLNDALAWTGEHIAARLPGDADAALPPEPDDTATPQSRRTALPSAEQERNGQTVLRGKGTAPGERTSGRFWSGKRSSVMRSSRHRTVFRLVLSSLLVGIVGIVGIPIYLGWQRVSQRHPTVTDVPTVPAHLEPTAEVGPGFTAYQNAHFSLAYPSDWTHTLYSDRLYAGNVLLSDDFKGAGNNEVLVGITQSVPSDQLQAFLGEVAHDRFGQWTLQGLATKRHVTYDNEQWLEDDYAVAVLEGQSNVTLEAHVLVANHGTPTYYLIVIDTRSSFATDAGKYSTPMLASFRFQG